MDEYYFFPELEREIMVVSSVVVPKKDKHGDKTLLKGKSGRKTGEVKKK